MKWKNILNGKRNETLVLVSIMLMIAMISYMHKMHLTDLEEKITSIYEDRLVAEDYIFDLAKKVNSKKTALSLEDEFIEKIAISNHSMDQLIANYERTKLTEDENGLLEKLKGDIRLSLEFENQLMHNPNLPKRSTVKKMLDDQYDLILADLDQLSEIQLYEGKRLLETSNQVIASNGITNKLEIALLIVIVLVFLMAVSSPRVLIKKDFWSTN